MLKNICQKKCEGIHIKTYPPLAQQQTIHYLCQQKEVT